MKIGIVLVLMLALGCAGQISGSGLGFAFGNASTAMDCAGEPDSCKATVAGGELGAGFTDIVKNLLNAGLSLASGFVPGVDAPSNDRIDVVLHQPDE